MGGGRCVFQNNIGWKIWFLVKNCYAIFLSLICLMIYHFCFEKILRFDEFFFADSDMALLFEFHHLYCLAFSFANCMKNRKIKLFLFSGRSILELCVFYSYLSTA